MTTHPADAGFDPDRIELIDQRAHQWLEAGPANSLVLLVARHGQVALHAAYGVARYDSEAPLQPDAVFWLASIAKPVTATAIMMLVESGQLSLNRPLAEYFPELSIRYGERILVHQLLTHTSGMADVFGPVPPAESPVPEGQHPRIHDRVAAICKRELARKPGGQNIYCSANFTLLGELVRRISGLRLDAFAREHIFEPLGMHSSSIGYDPQTADRHVWRNPAFLPPRMPPEMFFEHMWPAPDGGGCLHGSATDLLAFANLFRNGGRHDGQQLLQPSTVAEMTHNQIPGTGAVGWGATWVPEACWGLGWMIQGDARWPYSHGILQPRGTYYHQGGSGCGFWCDPEHDVTGIYLSSSPLDWETGNAHWQFDTFQNMVTAAVTHD